MKIIVEPVRDGYRAHVFRQPGIWEWERSEHLAIYKLAVSLGMIKLVTDDSGRKLYELGGPE